MYVLGDDMLLAGIMVCIYILAGFFSLRPIIEELIERNNREKLYPSWALAAALVTAVLFWWLLLIYGMIRAFINRHK